MQIPPGPLTGFKINLPTTTGGKTMKTTTSKLATTAQTQHKTKTPLQTMLHKTTSQQGNSIENSASQDLNSQPTNTIGFNASQDHNNHTTNTEDATTAKPKPKAEYVVVPYTKGLSESFKQYVVSMGYKLASRATQQSNKHSCDPMTKTQRTGDVG